MNLIALLFEWAMEGDTTGEIPEEVVYSVVCGLFLLATLKKCTQQLGGK